MSSTVIAAFDRFCTNFTFSFAGFENMSTCAHVYYVFRLLIYALIFYLAKIFLAAVYSNLQEHVY